MQGLEGGRPDANNSFSLDHFFGQQFGSRRRPVNSSEKSFVCDYPECGRSYYERKNLLQHQTLKHGRKGALRGSVFGRREPDEEPDTDPPQEESLVRIAMGD